MKQTNFEYIKNLSAEQFIELLRDDDTLFEMSFCKICKQINNCDDNCRVNVLEWLKMERVDGN